MIGTRVELTPEPPPRRSSDESHPHAVEAELDRSGVCLVGDQPQDEAARQKRGSRHQRNGGAVGEGVRLLEVCAPVCEAAGGKACTSSKPIPSLPTDLVEILEPFLAAQNP